jgi:hypothetical protein
LWIGFDAAAWKPNAVTVAAGGVNAVSGGESLPSLHAAPQDYMVCPPQLWLDGIKAGAGFIRQFVAMPLGRGYTVEAQVTGREERGGLRFFVYEPKPGRFPDAPPPADHQRAPSRAGPRAASMGLGAGGRMRQKIYPDPFGIATWDQDAVGHAVVHLVTASEYRAIVGNDLPPDTIDAKTYARYGLPWFDLYDEALGDVAAAKPLADVKSVDTLAEAAGETLSPDDSAEVSPDDVWRLGKPSS